MVSLSKQTIVSHPECLSEQQIEHLLPLISPWQWRSTERSSELIRTFDQTNYPQLIDLTHRIAKLSHQLNHHPDIYLSYQTLKVQTTTHSLDQRVSLNDFVLAYHINQLV